MQMEPAPAGARSSPALTRAFIMETVNEMKKQPFCEEYERFHALVENEQVRLAETWNPILKNLGSKGKGRYWLEFCAAYEAKKAEFDALFAKYLVAKTKSDAWIAKSQHTKLTSEEWREADIAKYVESESVFDHRYCYQFLAKAAGVVCDIAMTLAPTLGRESEFDTLKEYREGEKIFDAKIVGDRNARDRMLKFEKDNVKGMWGGSRRRGNKPKPTTKDEVSGKRPRSRSRSRLGK